MSFIDSATYIYKEERKKWAFKMHKLISFKLEVGIVDARLMWIHQNKKKYWINFSDSHEVILQQSKELKASFLLPIEKKFCLEDINFKWDAD